MTQPVQQPPWAANYPPPPVYYYPQRPDNSGLCAAAVLLAFFFPLLGFILGAAVAAKDYTGCPRDNTATGKAAIVISLLSTIVLIGILATG